MKLMIAPYNNGAGTWTETEETALRSYKLDHQFNRPAECDIVLGDPDGTILQKYNCDANDVYIGVGKLTLEDPTGTDIFEGRIISAIGNFDDRTVTLKCRDWLDQLDEELITYDMREKLGAGNLRQSVAHADPDGAFVDVAENNAGTFYFYDDNMVWANDAYNGMKLMFTTGMAGTRTWSVGPYDEVVTGDGGGIDADNGDETDLWVDDDNSHAVWDNDENWTQDYYFRMYVGHNTPSDFYVDDSIEDASFDITVAFSDDSGEDSLCEIQVYDVGAASWVSIDDLKPYNSARGTIKTKINVRIPANSLDCVDANGIMKLRFNVTRGAGTTYLFVYYTKAIVTTSTIGYSSPVVINDTINPNKLEVATDLTAAATRIWEGVPYCIARPIYKHIDTLQTPGTLVSDGNSIVTLTTAGSTQVTTGISTRQYKERTRLQILQDLAEQDNAVFWCILGTPAIYWKDTWPAHVKTLTDADVDSWQSFWDYSTMYNDYHVYGVRIGDYEIFQGSQDATSIAKFRATRSKIIKDSGVVSDVDAALLGGRLVTRDANPIQTVGCTISGNPWNQMGLGFAVEITSSYLWPAASKEYVVSRFAYDSVADKTYLTLQPNPTSAGIPKVNALYTKEKNQTSTMNTVYKDRNIADPVTHEVA